MISLCFPFCRSFIAENQSVSMSSFICSILSFKLVGLCLFVDRALYQSPVRFARSDSNYIMKSFQVKFLCISLGCLPALDLWNSFRFSNRIASHNCFSFISLGTNIVSPSLVSPLFQLSSWFALHAISSIFFSRVLLTRLVHAIHTSVGIHIFDVFVYMFLVLSIY